MCVTGKHKHPLANGKDCDNHQSESQQYFLNSSNGNNLILNNNASVTNSKVYHHHINGNNNNNNNNILCNNNQHGVSKSVILNYDKNTLEYKNNKNLILNQQQNKVDVNGNSNTTMMVATNYNNHQHHLRRNHSSTNSFANNQLNHNHQIYEKHLNGINQLKNELLQSKKHYITNGVENCVDSHQKSNKFHIAKNHHNGIDETDNHLLHTTTTANGLLSKNGITNGLQHHNHHRQSHHQQPQHIGDKDNSSSNVLENIPTNVNIHKVNGHLNGLLNSNGHSSIRNSYPTSVKVTEITNGFMPNVCKYQENEFNGHTRTSHESSYSNVNGNGSSTGRGSNVFVRNCSQHASGALLTAAAAATNGRSNDFSTIKINYVSRQPIVRGSSMTVSNGKTHSFHGTSLHEQIPTKISKTNIPNIVINEINGSDHIGSPSPSSSSSSSSSTSSFSSSSIDEKEEVQTGKNYFIFFIKCDCIMLCCWLLIIFVVPL